jgi:hypothetical protein
MGAMKRRAPARVNAKSTAVMLSSMMHRARTVAQLVEDTGLAVCTVRRYIRALHEHNPKVVFIAMRVPDQHGKMNTKAYMVGDAPDAPPCPKTAKQNEAAYAERKRKKGTR